MNIVPSMKGNTDLATTVTQELRDFNQTCLPILSLIAKGLAVDKVFVNGKDRSLLTRFKILIS